MYFYFVSSPYPLFKKISHPFLGKYFSTGCNLIAILLTNTQISFINHSCHQVDFARSSKKLNHTTFLTTASIKLLHLPVFLISF